MIEPRRRKEREEIFDSAKKGRSGCFLTAENAESAEKIRKNSAHSAHSTVKSEFFQQSHLYLCAFAVNRMYQPRGC